jgi:DNA mismatch repair protein MutS
LSEQPSKDKNETPLMKQYNGVKEKYPDALVLFRVGDFYETFGEDAVKTSKILGIVLTKRSNGTASEVALAGFPYHSLETYLPKLVKAGQRVAVCDQLEDPKMTKNIVKRGVTEVVTPGVAISDRVLEHKSNNYLASVYIEKSRAGLALVDISTGEFYVTEGEFGFISKTLNSFLPKEVLFQKNKIERFTELFGGRYYTYGLEDWVYSADYAKEQIQKQFETDSLKGYGIDKEPLSVIAAGAILHYLHYNQQDKLAHINKIAKIVSDDYVWLDPFTIRNLELVYSPNPGAITLLDVIDQTLTPMGGRMLRKWMVLPLKDKDKINYRHALVGHLIEHKSVSAEIRKVLHNISDLERIASKIAMVRVSPREMLHLKFSLRCIEELKQHNTSANTEFKILLDEMQVLLPFVEKIEKILYADAPAVIGKGRLIADGVHAELDEYRKLSTDSKNYLLDIQKREIDSTGISSLKIAFNNVFGYYIEVRNTHKDKVPDTWIRKQTLVNAERYITEELKVFETKILQAEDKINEIEFALFSGLVSEAADHIAALQKNSALIATLDCLAGFAKQAVEFDYVRPEVDDSLVIDIKLGRHPVIEKNLAVGVKYVPNDIYLDEKEQQIIMVTGPNMSGKSALLRQTALIVLMAQIGSYVPAKKVRMGVVDKVFTRVGASDNISTGESTFMVEMNETANILNNLSERSLILLDEIGRGTSTYDGISIAWSIAEYIHQYPLFKPKTLFATHYHELNEMTNIFPRVKNFNVSVKEIDGKIIFLRKLAVGGSEHSFGIHVAKLAGLPKLVIANANAVLERLEKQREGGNDLRDKIKPEATSGMQLSFIQLDDPVLQEIREDLTRLNINTLTPVEALMKLSEIKKRLVD